MRRSPSPHSSRGSKSLPPHPLPRAKAAVSSASAASRSIPAGAAAANCSADPAPKKQPFQPFTAVVVSSTPTVIVTTAADRGAADASSRRTPLHLRDRNAVLSRRVSQPVPPSPRSPRSAGSAANARSPKSPKSPKSPASSLGHRPLKPPALPPTTRPARPLSHASAPSPMRSLHTTTSAASPTTMGFDKDVTPRKPALAARAVLNRTPLTPKIAATVSKSNPAPTLAAAAQPHTTPVPMARRTAATSPSDLPAHLGNNVTPRSGPRQSRVDIGPTHTPPLSPSVVGLDERLRHRSTTASSGSGTANNNNNSDSKFFYASDARPTAATIQQPPPPMLAPARASNFFYANGQSVPDKPQQQQQPHVHHPHSVPPSHAPSITSSPPDLSSKFFHANGAALERTHPAALKSTVGHASPVGPSTASPKLAMSRSNSTYSNSASVVGGGASHGSQSRPLSPAKMPMSAQFSHAKSSAFPATPRSPGPYPASAPMSPAPGGRPRQSSATFTGHSRNGSVTNLTMAEPPGVARQTSSPAASHFQSSPLASPASAAVIGSPPAMAAMNLAAILQATDDLAQQDGDDDDDDDDRRSNASGGGDGDGSRVSRVSGVSGSGSGSGSGVSGSKKGDALPSQADELVVNARRERKVQDLQITNASLEAINRSLERQLRKQKTELRQFRRLSRSGRLSLAPSRNSQRITSGSTVEGPLQDPDRLLAGVLSDDDSALADIAASAGLHAFNADLLPEDDDEDDNDTSEVDASYSEMDRSTSPGSASGSGSESSPESPSTKSTRRRRKRDDRRLQRDLARHRQLLVDSQKINQSIKRCLSWTDELIEEGRKALAFQVRVSEVELASRAPADEGVVGAAGARRPKVTAEDASGLLVHHHDDDDDDDDDNDDDSDDSTSTTGSLAIDSDPSTWNPNGDGDKADNETPASTRHDGRAVRFDVDAADAAPRAQTTELPLSAAAPAAA